MKVTIKPTKELPKLRRGAPRRSDKYQYHKLKKGEHCVIECENREQAIKICASVKSSIKRDLKHELIQGEFLVDCKENVVTCYRVDNL